MRETQELFGKSFCKFYLKMQFMLKNWKLGSVANGKVESVVLPFVSYELKQRWIV